MENKEMLNEIENMSDEEKSKLIERLNRSIEGVEAAKTDTTPSYTTDEKDESKTFIVGDANKIGDPIMEDITFYIEDEEVTKKPIKANAHIHDFLTNKAFRLQGYVEAIIEAQERLKAFHDKIEQKNMKQEKKDKQIVDETLRFADVLLSSRDENGNLNHAHIEEFIEITMNLSRNEVKNIRSFDAIILACEIMEQYSTVVKEVDSFLLSKQKMVTMQEEIQAKRS